MGFFDIFKKKSSVNQSKKIVANLTPVLNIKSQKYSEISNSYEISRILEKVSYNGLVLSKDPEDYPHWFQYELGIEDPYKRVCELRDVGYVRNCSPDIALKKRTVPELKEELSRQGLSIKGNKPDLIARLIKDGELSSSFVPEVVELSDMGKQFLKGNTEILQMNQLSDYGLNIEQYQSFKNKMPNSDFYSIVIAILSDQDKILAERNEISMSRVKKYDIARAFEHKGDKKMALQYYIFSAYYALCEFELPVNMNVEYEINGALALKIHEFKDYYSSIMIENCSKWNIGGYYKKPDKKRFIEEIDKLINQV